MCFEFVVTIVLLNLTIQPLMADTRGTVEEVALTHVANAMSAYQILNGRLPSSWDQIGTVIDLDMENRAVKTAYGFRIQDRYQFVVGKLPLLDPLQSDVLMIRIAPFKDYRANEEIARTLIYRTKDGKVMMGVRLEEEVQKALRAANFQIGPPGGSAEVESNANRSKSMQSAVDSPGQTPMQEALSVSQAPAAMNPTSAARPSASPVAATPNAETPVAAVEHNSPVWLWLIGILALIVIVVVALKWRA